MDQAIAGDSAKDEITFREFLADFADARIRIGSFVLALMIAGVLIGIFGQKQYEATTVLAPVSGNGTGSGLGGLAALASQYSGLASLAGVQLPESQMKDEAMAVLQSQLLTRQYIQEHDLLPILYASKWNAASHQWRTTDARKVPTLWLANRDFARNIRTVVDDKKSGMIDMTIKWKNPQQAAVWANGLVSLTNSYLRNKAIREAELNIQYLNAQATKTSVVQEQEVIYALMQQQIEKEMIARDREEYALKIIDPAFPPQKPSSPGPILLGLLGFALGLFLSVVAVFVRRAAAA